MVLREQHRKKKKMVHNMTDNQKNELRAAAVLLRSVQLEVSIYDGQGLGLYTKLDNLMYEISDLIEA
jgi:hypothetical protein